MCSTWHRHHADANVSLSRKGFGEQAQEKLTPQSQKSTTEVISENVTGAGDKIASAVQPSRSSRSKIRFYHADFQPGSDKSTTQKAGDSLRGNGDSAQKQGGGIIDSATKTVTDTGT